MSLSAALRGATSPASGPRPPELRFIAASASPMNTVTQIPSGAKDFKDTRLAPSPSAILELLRAGGSFSSIGEFSFPAFERRPAKQHELRAQRIGMCLLSRPIEQSRWRLEIGEHCLRNLGPPVRMVVAPVSRTSGRI